MKFTVWVKDAVERHASLRLVVTSNGLVLALLPPLAARFGYADTAFVISTPGVVVDNVMLTAVAPTGPTLISGSASVLHSFGSRTALPPEKLTATLSGCTTACGVAPVADTAWKACRMPAPESRSAPATMMSSALVVRKLAICALVANGTACFSKAAMAAACGAAADVP